MTSLSLAGKRCVISGGSKGIGLAIARLFAAEGAGCTLIGRNSEALEAAVDSLQTTDDENKHSFTTFDVSTVNGWEKLASDMKSQKCNILVNAAGLSQNSFLYNSLVSDMDKIVATNLMGCIINVSSLLATHGGRGASVYAASKAGVIGLTRSLAWEVGRFGVRANVLLPGYIQTDMIKDMDKDGELSALIPMGRLGLAEEVADAALFLAKSPYAHNCVLNIDGGLSAT
ncbi:hypothetical protein AAE478_005742 [Parahypoxylon ruwenzoriense]